MAVRVPDPSWMGHPSVSRPLIGPANVQALAKITLGTDECGAQRARVVAVLRSVFADVHIAYPTRRDVRVVMVAWGLPNAVAELHAHVIAAMMRVDADVDEMMRS